MTAIALLRGINVSGKNPVKMTDLTKIFESLGFSQVRTYVQSGNVVFDHTPASAAALTKTIEDAILRTFGFPVRATVRTKDELEKIVRANPFAGKPGIEADRLHVTFLSEKRSASGIVMNAAGTERYAFAGTEVYLYCPDGYGRTKLNNAAFEKKLGVVATTRNWNSVRNLLALAKGTGKSADRG